MCEFSEILSDSATERDIAERAESEAELAQLKAELEALRPLVKWTKEHLDEQCSICKGQSQSFSECHWSDEGACFSVPRDLIAAAEAAEKKAEEAPNADGN